jgi:hypothetical protein
MSASDYAQAMAAVERTPEYRAADGRRAEWWAAFEQAERDGDGAAAAHAWKMAADAKREMDALDAQVRDQFKEAQA